MFPAFPRTRILLTFLYFLLIILANFLPPWSNPLVTAQNLAFLLLGAALGFILVEADHLIYALLTHPQELSSQRVASLLRQFKLKPAIDLLAATQSERQRLLLHSFLFQVVLLILAVWTLTSTASFFGKALVLAASFQLFLKQQQEYQAQGNINSWFWNFKLNLSPANQQVYLWLLLLLHLLFAWWV